MTVLRAAALRGLPALIGQLGGDPGRYFAAGDISADILNDDGAYVPHRKAIQLLERVAADLGCPNLGLRLAEVQDISVLGPLAVAMQHARTLGAALDRVQAHLYIHSPSLRLQLAPRARGQVGLSIAVDLPRIGPCPQTLDLSIGLSSKNLRLLAGEAYSPIAVHLSHGALASPAVYRAFFGAPVVFDADVDAIVMDESLLDLPLCEANAFLEQLIASYFDVQADGRTAGLVPQVRLLVSRLLRTDRCSQADVAASLRMHPRTLQRYLADRATSFDQIKEDVRRELALKHLVDTRVPLTTLAHILGYSELSAFSRSCRRWFDESPRELRRRLRSR